MLRFYQVVSVSVDVSSTQSLYCTPGSEESKMSLLSASFSRTCEPRMFALSLKNSHRLNQV